MRLGVVVFPGSNCDYDCYYVLRNVLQEEVDFIWHKEEDLSGYDCLVLPGGLSYGDYLRTGAIAKFSPIMKSMEESAKKKVEQAKPPERLISHTLKCHNILIVDCKPQRSAKYCFSIQE